MRKILLLAPALFVVSSCSITQKTASSCSLQPKLEQLTTVYELKVSPEIVRKDTTWTSGMFQLDKTPVSGVKSILMAEIIESKDADVLVEPRFSLKTKNNAFTKNYSLTIEGYPAKYVNFHTATPEEYDMLYGKRLSDLPGNITLAPCHGKQGKVRPTEILKEKTHKAKVASPKDYTWSRNPGFKFGIDLGIRAKKDLYTTSFQGDILLGGQINKNWYVGGGFGLGVLSEWDNYGHKYKDYLGLIYANGRYYFGGNKLAPFIDLRAGAMYLPDLCPYIRPAAGLSFKSFEFSLGPDIIVDEVAVFSFKVGVRF